MDPVTIGVIGAGALASVYGSMTGANAAKGAAEAQAAQAEENRRQILGYSQAWGDRARSLAEASPQELNVLGRSYQAAGKALDQQTRLMDAVDPALMEASKQALTLLRGGQAAVNGPLQQMRGAQRAQLVNSLRQQYGPGAETTSVGQRALQQFDMQSNMEFQQNQQSSLAQMMGIANDQAPGINTQRAIAGMNEVGQGYGNLATRKLNTELNIGGQTLGAMGGVGNQMLQTAGSQYAGQALQGAGISSLGNSFMNMGAYMYGANNKSLSENQQIDAGLKAVPSRSQGRMAVGSPISSVTMPADRTAGGDVPVYE